jgi:hypothetical protein
MKLLAKCFASAGFVLLLAGTPAFAQDINIDYNHNFKFNQMKGYSWGKIQISQPALEPRIVASIDNVLQGYGFKESGKVGETGKANDMIVTVVEARNPQEYATFYRSMSNLDWHRGWGGGGFSDSASSLRQIHPRTLVVDIYAGSTNKLIWRGTAAGGISGREPQSDADKTVATMFVQFPPKSGGPLAPNQQEAPSGPTDIPRTSPN